MFALQTFIIYENTLNMIYNYVSKHRSLTSIFFKLAKSKNREPAGWVLASIIISPLIVLIILAIMKTLPGKKNRIKTSKKISFSFFLFILDNIHFDISPMEKQSRTDSMTCQLFYL